MLNISETTLDRAIVTIEHYKEVACLLSNGHISNDLDGPLTRFSRSRHYYRTWRNYRQSIEWYHLQWPWVTWDPDFKVTTFFDIEYLRNNMKKALGETQTLRAGRSNAEPKMFAPP